MDCLVSFTGYFSPTEGCLQAYSSLKFSCLYHSRITTRKRICKFFYFLLYIQEDLTVFIFHLFYFCYQTAKNRCMKYVPRMTEAERFFIWGTETEIEWNPQMIHNLPAWRLMTETVQILDAIKDRKWNKALPSPNMPIFSISHINNAKKETKYVILKHRPRARALHFVAGGSEHSLWFLALLPPNAMCTPHSACHCWAQSFRQLLKILSLTSSPDKRIAHSTHNSSPVPSAFI